MNSHTESAVGRSGRVFYGWVVVACTFIVLTAAYGVQFSYGVLMPEIQAETGWSRTSLSLVYAVYVFVYSALGIVTGLCTDRWGPRIVITVGGVLLGVGVMLSSQARELWQLYLSFGLLAALGMSAAFVPCSSTVVRWFAVRRGLALSICASGSSFGTFVIPPLAAALMPVYGWRVSYFFLGLCATAVIAVCAVFTVRDPESMGLRPDGTPPENHDFVEANVGDSGANGWTLSQARKTRAMWVLMAVFTATWLVVFLPMVHIVPFAVDMGISQIEAAGLLSVIGLGGFMGRLIMGPLSDRYGRTVVLGGCLVFEAVAFGGFSISTDLALLYPSALLFGFAYGGTTALFPAIVGDFYGRLAVGAIVGFIFSVAGSMAAIGPVAAGYIFDTYGSYKFAFELSAGSNLLGLAMLFFLKKPRAQQSTQ